MLVRVSIKNLNLKALIRHRILEDVRLFNIKYEEYHILLSMDFPLCRKYYDKKTLTYPESEPHENSWDVDIDAGNELISKSTERTANSKPEN